MFTTNEYFYTVSQKSTPDIFDCNLKTNYQVMIMFGTNIPDTTCFLGLSTLMTLIDLEI